MADEEQKQADFRLALSLGQREWRAVRRWNRRVNPYPNVEQQEEQAPPAPAPPAPVQPEASEQEEPAQPEALQQEEPAQPEALQQEEPAPEGGAPDPKEVHKLWTWYRLHDMQQVTHIGEEETDDCWKKLQGLKRKKQLENDPELYNLLASLRKQYLSFTGKAQR